jgi:hypothetical protein
MVNSEDVTEFIAKCFLKVFIVSNCRNDYQNCNDNLESDANTLYNILYEGKVEVKSNTEYDWTQVYKGEDFDRSNLIHISRNFRVVVIDGNLYDRNNKCVYKLLQNVAGGKKLSNFSLNRKFRNDKDKDKDKNNKFNLDLCISELTDKFGINFNDVKAKKEIEKMEDTLNEIKTGVIANTDAISKLRIDPELLKALIYVNELFEDKDG